MRDWFGSGESGCIVGYWDGRAGWWTVLCQGLRLLGGGVLSKAPL